jgi:hypothetical protein
MDSVVTEFNGLTYVVGGHGSSGAVQIYDPSTDTWSTGTTEPSPEIDYPIDGGFGFDEDGHPVILLLPDATGSVSGVWHRYDIQDDAWDTPALPSPLPSAGLWAADFACDRVNNVVYISGGASSPGGGDRTTLYAYYPDTNTAALLGNFTHIPSGFNFHASWLVPWMGTLGSVCVAGGLDLSNRYADTQCYDIATGTFNAPNADLGALPDTWLGMADMVSQVGGYYQLWLAGGMYAGSISKTTAYFSQLDSSWHSGPQLMRTTFRVEGDTQLGDPYVLGGSSGGFNYQPYNQHLVQPWPEIDVTVNTPLQVTLPQGSATTLSDAVSIANLDDSSRDWWISERPYYCDDFNRSDSTTVNGWTEEAGDLRIESNRLRSQPGFGNADLITWNALNAVNVEVFSDVHYSGSSRTVYCAHITRWTSNSDCLFVKVQDNNADGDFDTVWFYVGNNAMTSWKSYETVTPFTSARIRSVVVGNTYTFSIDRDFDGVYEDEFVGTPPILGLGKAGLGGFDDAEMDNFCVATASWGSGNSIIGLSRVWCSATVSAQRLETESSPYRRTSHS